MNARGYDGILVELCHWTTFLTKALPLRSMGVFVELLIGAMLTPSGFVTDAYLMVNMRNHWTSYCKWLQQGKWSWLALARQFMRLVLANVKCGVIHLAKIRVCTLYPHRDGKVKRDEAENMARNTHPSVLNIWTVGLQH
jgi:hypothetical protein